MRDNLCLLVNTVFSLTITFKKVLDDTIRQYFEYIVKNNKFMFYNLMFTKFIIFGLLQTRKKFLQVC